ncbi:MAG: glycosyltransferase [Trichodesmium sp. MAG_R04]|nr:glycosyltransferase [Trichodesmium sp. MAG_R04]
MSYREKQKRYQSLVREAWEKYQQGENSQMVSLLEQSLEYTPYLRAETVSDWVTQFAQISTKERKDIDIDLLSDLTEWNQMVTYATTSQRMITTELTKNTTILFAGHDLRFVTPLIEYYSDHCEVLVDKWKATKKHDQALSNKLLEQANIIICEWCVGNAVWYSQHKKPSQKMFIRLHKFELFTEYPAQVEWKSVNGIIFIAPKMRETALDKFDIKTNCHLIYNCIHTQKFNLAKKEGCEYNLGFLGYLPKTKRLDLAIEVLLKLRRKSSNYKLFIKGKHPSELSWIWQNKEEKDYYNPLLKRIESKELKGCVFFEGYGQNVPEWFQNVGYVLSVSDVEGSHQAVAEGMSSATIPMISGGFYHNYAAASLYPQRYCCESVDDIVRRIHFLNQDESLRFSLQEEVKEYAQRNFDAQVISEQWDNLLLNKPSSFSSKLVYSTRDFTRILLYADINLNIIDGSSIWLTSLINTLAIEKTFKICLLLKSSLSTSTVVNNIEEINSIEIIDPFAGEGLLSQFENYKELTARDSIRCLIYLDKNRKFDTICIRSSHAVNFLKDQKDTIKKSIFYSLSSIKQEYLKVLNNSKYIAAQTELLADNYVNRGIHKDKIFILPPMIKDVERNNIYFKRINCNLVYCGKLSAGYHAVEIIKAFKYKLAHRRNYNLHLIVAKIMINDQPSYTKELNNILQNNDDKRIKIYYEITRNEVLKIIQECSLGISWRSPEFDRSLELSTKTLEYSSLGKPVILNRNPINESLYGKDYPLYANTEDEFCAKVDLALSNQEVYSQASQIAFGKSQQFMFSKVREKIRSKFVADRIMNW